MVSPAVRLPTSTDALNGALGQFRLLANAVDTLPADAFGRPTRLEGWTVAELVAHLVSNVDAVTRGIDRPPPDERAMNVLTYLSAMRPYAPAVAARAVELAADVAPADLRSRLRAAVDAAEQAVLGEDEFRVVAVRLGAIHLSSFLVTRCVEGVVHGLDLRAATGVPDVPDDTALRAVVRTLAMLLTVSAPGRSVEVRIPGHLAVQCVEGPAHTRGTPGSVVETDAITFIELTTGRVQWADAVSDGRLHASGERSDLSALLPLIG